MTSVALAEIVFDDEIYPRASWSKTTVDRYVDAMRAGDTFPPIILETGTNRLLDGRHRTEAYRVVGRDLIPVDHHEIPEGVPAKLYAASLSSRHGDPIKAEEKRRTAREVVEANPDYSQVFIASYLGISRQTVSKYVGDLVEHRREVRKAKAALLSKSGKSVREIADVLGVSKSEVSRNVADDNPGQLTEDVLREAAADLPVDVTPVVDAMLREREEPTDTKTPEPAAESSTAPVAGSGSTSPEPEPRPEPKPTLTLVPTDDEERAAEQRDARARLRRAVDLLIPAGGDTVEGWARRLGPYDDELSELTSRAADAMAVLDALIEGAGQ